MSEQPSPLAELVLEIDGETFRAGHWSLATVALGAVGTLEPGQAVDVLFHGRGPGSPSPRVPMRVLRTDAAEGRVSLGLLELDRKVLLLLADMLRLETPAEAERRVTFRHRNPTLEVEIAGQGYSTMNWSLTGLLLGGFDPDLAGFLPSPDQLIEVRFRNAGDAVPWAYTTVVRFDPDLQLLALRLAEFGRPVLDHLAAVLNRHKAG